MSKFAQYALAAASEAMDDAGWKPTREQDLEETVRAFSPSPPSIAEQPSGRLSWLWDRQFR